MIIPEQCRAGRALVRMNQANLASAAGIAKQTLVDFERGARQPYEKTLADIQRSLEGAGVEFIPANGSGAGVRLHGASVADEDEGQAPEQAPSEPEPETVSDVAPDTPPADVEAGLDKKHDSDPPEAEPRNEKPDGETETVSRHGLALIKSVTWNPNIKCFRFEVARPDGESADCLMSIDALSRILGQSIDADHVATFLGAVDDVLVVVHDRIVAGGFSPVSGLVAIVAASIKEAHSRATQDHC